MYHALAELAALFKQNDAISGVNDSSAFTGAMFSKSGFSSSLSQSLRYAATLCFSFVHHWRSVGLSCTDVVVTLISGYSENGMYGCASFPHSRHQRTTRRLSMLSLCSTSGTTEGIAPRSSAQAVIFPAAVMAERSVVACFFQSFSFASSVSLNKVESLSFSSAESEFHAEEALKLHTLTK